MFPPQHSPQSFDLSSSKTCWNVLKQRIRCRRWRTIAQLKAVLLDERDKILVVSEDKVIKSSQDSWIKEENQVGKTFLITYSLMTTPCDSNCVNFAMHVLYNSAFCDSLRSPHSAPTHNFWLICMNTEHLCSSIQPNNHLSVPNARKGLGCNCRCKCL